MTDQVLGSGLMRMMYLSPASCCSGGKGRRGRPYQASRTFSVALLNVIAPPQPHRSRWRRSGTRSGSRPESQRGRRMWCRLRPVGRGRDEHRVEIEHWFDSAMSRLSGWYKWKTYNGITVSAFVVVSAPTLRCVRPQTASSTMMGPRAARWSRYEDSAKPGDGRRSRPRSRALAPPIAWSKKPGDLGRGRLTNDSARANSAAGRPPSGPPLAPLFWLLMCWQRRRGCGVLELRPAVRYLGRERDPERSGSGAVGDRDAGLPWEHLAELHELPIERRVERVARTSSDAARRPPAPGSGRCSCPQTRGARRRCRSARDRAP